MAELERRYRQAHDPVAHDPVARRWWPIVWRLARGQPSEQVGEATGYSLTGGPPVALTRVGILAEVRWPGLR